MFCKECGNEIANDSKFCQNCGTAQFKATTPINERNVNIISEVDPKPDLKMHKEESNDFKYDSEYKGDSYISNVGFAFVIFNVATLYIAQYQDDNLKSILVSIVMIEGFISWLLAIRWVVMVAEKQNRNSTFWGVFAVLIPYLAMIIIGFLKKVNNRSISTNYKTNWAVIAATFILPIVLALIILFTEM